jgi:hypothetical protein
VEEPWFLLLSALASLLPVQLSLSLIRLVDDQLLPDSLHYPSSQMKFSSRTVAMGPACLLGGV